VELAGGKVQGNDLAWHVDVGINPIDVNCPLLSEHIEALLNECDDRATPIMDDPDEVYLGMIFESLTQQSKTFSQIQHQHVP